MRKFLKIFGTMMVALLMAGAPALAALEWTNTVLYFNIAANDEVTVTLLTEAGTTTTDVGASTPQGIEFNSTTGTSFWVNATITGTAADVQTDTVPILVIDNTGNTDCQLNISLATGAGVALDACQKLRYHTAYQTAPNTGGLLLNSTTNITLDETFTSADAAVNIWLWGNFTGCLNTADTSPTFSVYAKFA